MLLPLLACLGGAAVTTVVILIDPLHLTPPGCHLLRRQRKEVKR